MVWFCFSFVCSTVVASPSSLLLNDIGNSYYSNSHVPGIFGDICKSTGIMIVSKNMKKQNVFRAAPAINNNSATVLPTNHATNSATSAAMKMRARIFNTVIIEEKYVKRRSGVP